LSTTSVGLMDFLTLFFILLRCPPFSSFFFFTVPATTEIYTLSLHDALPILVRPVGGMLGVARRVQFLEEAMNQLDLKGRNAIITDRKSTRLNSSHRTISYAVFCLKKKKKKKMRQ